MDSSLLSGEKKVAWTDLAMDAAYGERKTARILTGTPILVNTAKRPEVRRASRIYEGYSKFKQTFVLDLRDGVDIMRPFTAGDDNEYQQRRASPDSYKKILLSPE
jgi:hypothetical protein